MIRHPYIAPPELNVELIVNVFTPGFDKHTPSLTINDELPVAVTSTQSGTKSPLNVTVCVDAPLPV